MKLSKNIHRLILRNSHFEKIERSHNILKIIFNCAKLENLFEVNINTPVILNKTTLKIYGISNEELKIFHADYEFKIIEFSSEIINHWIKVEHTYIDDKKHTLCISGDYFEDKKCWAELSLQFEKCEIEFESYCII